jgi:hypothetical protein
MAFRPSQNIKFSKSPPEFPIPAFFAVRLIKGRSSFLKKRSKTFVSPRADIGDARQDKGKTKRQKSFGSFLQKRIRLLTRQGRFQAITPACALRGQRGPGGAAASQAGLHAPFTSGVIGLRPSARAAAQYHPAATM